MKIFLVRHAETEENVMRIVQGLANGKLSARGIEQVKKVATRLSKEKIDAVFSSPLERADLTAQEIAKQHDLKVIYDDLLVERSHGKFDGIHVDEYWEDTRRSGLPKHEYRPEGGESYGDVARRAESFYKMLLEKYHRKTVVIVSHGTFNRVFLSIMGHAELERAPYIDQENTCVNIIEIAAGKPRVSLVNCTKHME